MLPAWRVSLFGLVSPRHQPRVSFCNCCNYTLWRLLNYLKAMAGQADLPEGVWSLILSFCDSQSVVRFGATCHRNKQRANDELVWKPRVESALGSGVATEPSSWRCESYQQLFTRFLRVYAPLLGAWNGETVDRQSCSSGLYHGQLLQSANARVSSLPCPVGH